MGQHPHELDPVPAADSGATEIARVWGARSGQYVSLNDDLWRDPAAWGITLVDLAKHVANAHVQAGRGDAKTVLRKIKQGFDAHWGRPVSPAHKGGLTLTEPGPPSAGS